MKRQDDFWHFPPGPFVTVKIHKGNYVTKNCGNETKPQRLSLSLCLSRPLHLCISSPYSLSTSWYLIQFFPGHGPAKKHSIMYTLPIERLMGLLIVFYNWMIPLGKPFRKMFTSHGASSHRPHCFHSHDHRQWHLSLCPPGDQNISLPGSWPLPF